MQSLAVYFFNFPRTTFLVNKITQELLKSYSCFTGDLYQGSTFIINPGLWGVFWRREILLLLTFCETTELKNDHRKYNYEIADGDLDIIF